MTAAMQLADRVRAACVVATLEGYARARIAGRCPEGAGERAVDAIRIIELRTLLRQPAPGRPPGPRGPASA